MPCTVDTTEEDRRTLKKLIAERNELTRMLCELCGLCDDMKSGVVRTVPGLYAWWNQHKESDAKRKERLKKKAISKLTDEELEALGLSR
jgi:hypothetical protein